MSKLEEYCQLIDRLFAWRPLHPEDTAEEDQLIDEIGALWWELTMDERPEAEAYAEMVKQRYAKDRDAR